MLFSPKILALLFFSFFFSSLRAGDDLDLFVNDSEFFLERKTDKAQVENGLKSCANIFQHLYALKKWKERYLGWDLTRELDDVIEKLEEKDALALEEIKHLYLKLVNSTHDTHVSISFHDPRIAYIPGIELTAIGSDLYVKEVRALESEEGKLQYPLFPGDRILLIDSLDPISYCQHHFLIPTHIRAFTEHEYGNWFKPQDPQHQKHAQLQREKALFLSAHRILYRLGQRNLIPKKEFLNLTVDRNGQVHRVQLPWKKSTLISPLENALKTESNEKSYSEQDPYITAKKIQAGDLEVSWIQIDDFSLKGREQKELRYFYQALQKADQDSDALVIDLRNNPGGALHNLFIMATFLIDEPLIMPVESTLLSKKAVQKARTIVNLFNCLLEQTDGEFTSEFNQIFVIPEEFDASQIIKGVYHHSLYILEQDEKGRLFTDFFPDSGIEQLNPSNTAWFNKPIYICINELSASCADLFPAIFKDNKRALLIGRPTCGAGGSVVKVPFSPHEEISHLRLTSSISLRTNRRIIENLGVEPDILYHRTKEDLNNPQRFEEAVLQIIEEEYEKTFEQNKSEGI